MDKSLIHFIFVFLTIGAAFVALILSTLGMAQKNDRMRKLGMMFMTLSGLLAIPLAAAGYLARQRLENPTPEALTMIHTHMTFGGITVGTVFLLAIFSVYSLFRYQQKAMPEKEGRNYVVMAMVVMGLMMLTVSLGGSVLESGTSVHKENFLRDQMTR